MAAMTEVEAKKALQTEVMAVKQKWGDAIKLSKTKDGPTAPLPISLQRTIQAPEDASAYDVAEYKVKLWLDSLDVSGEPLVRVEIDPADLVPSLASKMEERVGAQWRSELKARGLGKGWLLEKMFSWCESKFVELLNLEPACLDMYMGDDANGMTIRRFALVEKVNEAEAAAAAAAAAVAAAEEEEGESEGEDEDPAVRKERERLERIRIKAEEEADRVWREARRKEFEELGEDQRPKPMAGKQQIVTRKEKQGHRTAKTGSKANKPSEESKQKAIKSKKSGLIH